MQNDLEHPAKVGDGHEPRLLVVGCGAWGRLIVRDLVALGCKVDVVARSDDSRKRALEHGANTVFRTIQEPPQPDGIVIATPTTTHASIVSESTGRGVPIFVEKPLSCDVQDAQELAQEHGSRVFVMDKWRYHPGVLEMARIAKSNELGAVIGLRTTRLSRVNPHSDTDVIWHLLPHDLAIAQEVLGHIPRPVFAHAEVVEGIATGLIGVLGDGPWHIAEVGGRSPVHRRWIELHCDDGVALLEDAYSDGIKIGRGSEDVDVRPISNEMPLLAELRSFVNHILGGPAPKSSAAEAALNVATIATLRQMAGLR